MSQKHNFHGAVIARFFLTGTTLGMLAGLYEAVFLYSTPRVEGLIQPDISYAIWFVAPLAGLVLFALLGLVVGLVVAWIGRVSVSKIAAAALAGLAGTYMAGAVELLQARSGELFSAHNLMRPMAWGLVIFSWALCALRIGRQRASRFFEHDKPWQSGRWATTLLFVATVFLMGAGFYVVRRESLPAKASSPHLSGQGQPNIVLIVLDTVRADHLSSYGYPRPTTPNLDHFAAQGVAFDNAVSASSWTLPSICSIFTGLLPHQHGANSVMPLEAHPPTLAEVLASWGYETVGFNANPSFGIAGWGIGRGFDLYDDDSFSLRHNLKATLMGRTLAQRAYESTIRYDRFDRRNARQLNRDVFRWLHHRVAGPYFLFINYFDAHSPYAPPRPYNRRFGAASDSLLRKVETAGYGRLLKPLSWEEQESLTAEYDNCLSYLDAQVGELLRFLEALTEWSNTFVIITSDHGEAFGEHQTYYHGWNLYRELLHVPLIVAGPGIPQGQRISHLTRIREIPFTVLDLASREKPAYLHLSHRRFWTAGLQPRATDDSAISEVIDYTPDPERRAFISLMTADYHYLHVSGSHPELYDWPRDPEEKHNLAVLSGYQQIVRKLDDLLYKHVGSTRRPWRGLPYLLALDRPGDSILNQAYARASHPMATPQGLFGLLPSRLALQPDPEDQESLRTLPYH